MALFFFGIYPGISPIEISHSNGEKNIFQRKPIHMYGLMRPGLENHIQYRELPTLKDAMLEDVFRNIQASWIE